jgi:hypothetical protein
MRYLRKFNEDKMWFEKINDVKELIYTIEDIFVDLKDMGCSIQIYPNPDDDKDHDFERLVSYINNKLDFSDPPFIIYIKGGIFSEYKKTASNCLNILKRTLEKLDFGGTPRGLYVSSAKYEYIDPHNYASEQATIIKITKP